MKRRLVLLLHYSTPPSTLINSMNEWLNYRDPSRNRSLEPGNRASVVVGCRFTRKIFRARADFAASPLPFCPWPLRHASSRLFTPPCNRRGLHLHLHSLPGHVENSFSRPDAAVGTPVTSSDEDSHEFRVKLKLRILRTVRFSLSRGW